MALLVGLRGHLVVHGPPIGCIFEAPIHAARLHVLTEHRRQGAMVKNIIVSVGPLIVAPDLASTNDLATIQGRNGHAIAPNTHLNHRTIGAATHNAPRGVIGLYDATIYTGV